jgi:4-amino-4-deoxy-L-arabinose transferase-like glycosyltransferase
MGDRPPSAAALGRRGAARRAAGLLPPELLLSSAPAAPRREILAVAALALLPLLPFLPSALSIDAPVFVAVARRIIEAPLDPFGFQMVWDPTSPDVARMNRNPPLLSYWLAPWMAWLGESDLVLHALVLPFPLVAALAFFGIARRLCGEGLAPTALLVTTPAFVVLATSLLLDVPALAFLLLAVHAFLRGAEGQGSPGWQWAAGLAAAAAGLTKYVAFAGLPLLAAGCALWRPRSAARALRVLAPPLLSWTLWGAWTAELYGAPHFLGSTDVVLDRGREAREFWNQVVSAPVYCGAALVFPIAFWAARLAGGRRGAELAVVAVLFGTAAVYTVLPGGEPLRRSPLEVEEAVLAALGFAGAFFLVVECLRPPHSVALREDRFLSLWLAGVLAYSLFANWHVNAGDALLAAPPLLLALFRRPRLRPGRRFVAACAAAQLALSLLLAAADAIQAGFYRSAARRIAAEIGEQPGARWHVGHWGFQHYLAKQGFAPILPPHYGRSELAVGDWVASARNVSQLDVSRDMSRYGLREVWTWTGQSPLPLRTINADAGAGFYSHHSGYVPFAWSTLPIDEVALGRVVSARGGSAASPR